MRRAGALLLVALAFAAAPLLDERVAGYGGVAPKAGLAARATHDDAGAARAIDAAAETVWEGAVGETERWLAAFDAPLVLVGLHLDVGNDLKKRVRHFRMGATGLDGEVRTVAIADQEQRFLCWNTYSFADVYPATGFALSPRVWPGADERSRWALRDARFLVDDPLVVDRGAYVDALGELVLPLALALVWLAWLARGQRPRSSRSAR